MKASPLERVLRRVVVDDGGCWRCTLTHIDGYAQVRVDGRIQYAHRVVYEWLVDQIPSGLTLDHLCRVRDCVRPDHLEPVTMRENLMRGSTFVARNAAKTHCPSGHPYTGVNLYLNPQGGRECRACRRARKRAGYRAASNTPNWGGAS